MADDRRINRRNFFRQGLGELLRPLAQAAGPLEEAIRQISSLESELLALGSRKSQKPKTDAGPMVRGAAAVWLRPPGALPEPQFQDTCSRCGECVKVCPVQCIKIDPHGARGGGAPYIDPDIAPCVMCSGLVCTHHCPSGALLPTPIQDVDMGTAVWNSSSCIRTSGQSCTICIEHCPLGEVAIRLDGNRVEVLESGCTGCGVCQHDCPTTPKSITVIPRPSAGPVSRARK